jgi:hypothetical protein
MNFAGIITAIKQARIKKIRLQKPEKSQQEFNLVAAEVAGSSTVFVRAPKY